MKGFILKPHEAQALAAGKSVMIWRPCKPQPEFCGAYGEQSDINQWGWMTDADPKFLPVTKCCPFPVGIPLFGKETWDGCEVDVIRYKADGGPAYNDNGRGVASWKTSVHMPEWASRITLTLSDVKVRRPCDVTEEEEAIAMGIPPAIEPPNLHHLIADGWEWCPHLTEFRGIIEDANKDGWNFYHFTALATPA